MRERIFNLLEGHGRATSAYAVFMTTVTALSLLPLCFKQQGPVLEVIEIVCTVLFIIDYAMRWATADFKLGRGGASFARYPVTPMALVDLLSILPTFLFINPAFRAVRIIRLLRVLRVFRFVRYSRSLTFVMAAFKRQRNALLAMLAVALGYVFVCALGIVAVRRRCIAALAAKGGRFATLAAPSAVVHATARLGEGCLVLDHAIVSADVKLGDHVLCHANVLLGHDTRVGDHAVVESYAFTGGFAEIGAGATLHTRATVLPGKRVGEGAVVGAGSVVLASVPAGKTVFGVPAVDIGL